MPGPLAIPLGLAAGSSLAWLAASAPPSSAAGSELRARAAASYFGIFALGPAVALLELAAMSWANLYVAELPSAAGLLLAIAAGASPVVGERIARARLDRGDARTPLGLALAGAVVTLLGAAIARDRIETVATQSAFARGLGGTPLLEHRASVVLAVALVAVLAGYALAVRALAGPPHDARTPRRGAAAGRAARRATQLPRS